MWRSGDRLVKRIYLTEPRPRSAAVRREVGEGKKQRGGTRGDPGIKLPRAYISSASPAVTPDLQEPSALVVFISASKQQGHKDPANKDWRNRLFKESRHVEHRSPTGWACLFPTPRDLRRKKTPKYF